MSSNPYESPFGTQIPNRYAPGLNAAPARRWSGFIAFIFGMDIGCCMLRLLAVGAGFIGMAHLPASSPIAQTARYELITGLAIVVCGIMGDILLLAKKEIGLVFASGAIVSTIASFAVGIWQICLLNTFPPGSTAFIGYVIGASASVGVRSILLILYCVAFRQAWKKFSEWEGATA